MQVNAKTKTILWVIARFIDVRLYMGGLQKFCNAII